MVAALLTAGADPGAGRMHQLPLQVARDPEVVRLLVEAGAPLEIPREEGISPLEQAAAVGSEASVRILLKAGARTRDSEAVALAAQAGEEALVDLLLRKGAPLGRAAGVGRGAGVIRRLLAEGADPNAQSAGNPWLFVAVGHQDAEAVALLLAAGADPDATGGGGRTALMMAAMLGRGPAVVDALLAGGASRTAKDANGLTAADYAARSGDPALAERLR